MNVREGVRHALGAVMLAAALVTGVAAATEAELPVLGRLETGLWQLRSLDNGRTLAAICLGDRGQLAQPHHRGIACSRNVVSRAQDAVEIRYNCPAAFGQTAIRVETPRLARIESQGVDNGVPFGFRAEARRVGACR
ncbi:MAG: hypothetical protein QOI38_1346 [Sphingomonadales bacterium]|jgi:hypothetical protein|nr:hypothetical protein [Sphingomonadales bacterium]